MELEEDDIVVAVGEDRTGLGYVNPRLAIEEELVEQGDYAWARVVDVLIKCCGALAVASKEECQGLSHVQSKAFFPETLE